MDKIIPIWRNKGDITDPQKGRDLIVTLSLTKSGNGKEYTAVSSVIPEDVGPLHSDESIAQEWINDELVWSDVYSKKPVEYLEMVAKGETPRWDSDSKKWVSDSTAEETIGVSKSSTPDLQDSEDVDSELPF